MTRTYRTDIVDVFAETRLAGNQLAVVHDAGSLSETEMQAIALETNFSETTFVLSRGDGRATVRIFTPAWELPFAGHPTIGTAWVLTEGEGEIILDLPVGPVEVFIRDGVAWMTPPEVTFSGTLDITEVAALVGLESDDLAADWPVELASVGPDFVLVPVKDLATLKRARLNAEHHVRLLSDGVGVQCVFLFCDQPYSVDADFSARMFFESGGIREDPATGSANTAFAAYLRKHRGNIGNVVVEQGMEINRPSRLYLCVEDSLQVGGKVQPVFRGELSL